MSDEYVRSAEDHLRDALCQLLDSTLPEGMWETPRRWVKAMGEMTQGYGEDAGAILGVTFDAGGYDEVVAVRDVPFTSLCEHHLLPFVGTAGIAYMPKDRVVGLSKLARLIDVYARRFQIQERMTKQIGDALEEHLTPRGVVVVVSASHSCMSCRGVTKSGASMVTSMVTGRFRESDSARAEALALLGVGSGCR